MVIDPTRQANLNNTVILKHSTIVLKDGLMRKGYDKRPAGRGSVDDAMPIINVFEKAPVQDTMLYFYTWRVQYPKIENMLEYTIVLIGCTDSETRRGLSQLLPMPRNVSSEVERYHRYRSGSRTLLRRRSNPHARNNMV